MSPHPSLQELSGYAYGTLPEEQADTVADHVAACGECETVVSQMEAQPDEFVAGLRAPAEIDAVAAEPACQQAVERIQQIGSPLAPSNPRSVCELTSLSADRANVGDCAGTTTDLGQFGPYRLLEKLGEGGMGSVYKALHTKLKRTVAVKMLPAELTRDPRSIARFEREMEAVGKLDHPNIVRASDADEHNGTHYLVMEYVAGEDLSRLVKRLGPLPIADACELVRQAALGLQHAHEHGLVHRDIKPSNLMISVAKLSRRASSIVAKPSVAKLSPRASSPASSAREPALGEGGAGLNWARARSHSKSSTSASRCCNRRSRAVRS